MKNYKGKNMRLLKKKVVLLVLLFVLVFAISACDSTTSTDGGFSKTTGDVKKPSDENEPTDENDQVSNLINAIDLFVDVKLNAQCEEDGEAYALTIDTAGYYSIKSISNLDLEASISDFNTKQFIAFNDNRSDTDNNFELLVYLDAGKYLLGVSSEDDVDRELYQLLVQEVYVAHTTSITTNTVVTDSVLKTETNVVEFVVPSAGNVKLYTDSDYDTYGKIYDATGTIVTENDNGNSKSDFYIEVYLQAGTYTVEITANGTYTMAEYLLMYDFESDTRVYETITLNGFVTSSSTGYVRGYFELTITEAVVVNIYSTSDYDLEGAIFMSKNAFAPIKYNDDGGTDYNFLLANVSLSPGVYYIEVDALEDPVSSYEVHVDTVE